jgi:hypothetical protein
MAILVIFRLLGKRVYDKGVSTEPSPTEIIGMINGLYIPERKSYFYIGDYGETNQNKQDEEGWDVGGRRKWYMDLRIYFIYGFTKKMGDLA